MGKIPREQLIKGIIAVVLSLVMVGAVYAVESISVNQKASREYTAGTYTASAAGMESDVTVTMTFDADGITDVEVDVSGETETIGALIGEDMEQMILDAQDSEVDGVSGATVSSTAVMEAAADCIAQATGN